MSKLEVPDKQPRPPHASAGTVHVAEVGDPVENCPSGGFDSGRSDTGEIPLPLAECFADDRHKSCLGECREKCQHGVEGDTAWHFREAVVMVRAQDSDDDYEMSLEYPLVHSLSNHTDEGAEACEAAQDLGKPLSPDGPGFSLVTDLNLCWGVLS